MPLQPLVQYHHGVMPHVIYLVYSIRLFFYLNSWRDINSQICWSEFINLLLFGLHDGGQRGVARLVESQIGRQNCRKIDLDSFQTSVNLAKDLQAAVALLELGGTHGLE